MFTSVKQSKAKQNLIGYFKSLKHNNNTYLIPFFRFQIVVLTFWNIYLSDPSERSGQLHFIARFPKRHCQM